MEERESNKKESLYEAIYANYCQVLSAWPDAPGFQTPTFRSRTAGQSNNNRLAEAFLINTRLVRHDCETQEAIEGYFTDETTAMLSLAGRINAAGLPEVVLPGQAPMPMALNDAIKQRRSCRTYSGEPLSLSAFATLCNSAGGVTATAQVVSTQGQTGTYRFRASTSAGGLYPIDIYIAALNVTGIERGCYRYNPLPNTMTCIGDDSDLQQLLQCFAVSEEQISLSRASVIFLMAGRPWRAMRKYGSRGMRFLFHEAGALSSHIHLAAVALGLGSVDCASFYDDEVHEAMGWDGLYRALVHCIIVGRVK